jgi:hypothetical protein
MGNSTESIAPTEAVRPGIRGGLLLLVLWLGLIDPLYSLVLNGFMAMRWQQAYPEHAAYYVSWDFWWFITLRAGLRFVAALILLLRRRPDAFWFVVAILWLSGPLLVFVSWLTFDNQVMPWALIRSTAVAAAATLYLLRSARVRVTYDLKDHG